MEKGFNILMPIFFFKGENLSNKNSKQKGNKFYKKGEFCRITLDLFRIPYIYIKKTKKKSKHKKIWTITKTISLSEKWQGNSQNNPTILRND